MSLPFFLDYPGDTTAGTVNSSSTSIISLTTGGRFINTSTTTARIPIREAVTFSKLRIMVSASTVGATSTYAFRKNGSAGTQSVSIAASTTGEFIDNVGTDTVASGDQIDSLLTTGAGGTSMTVQGTALSSNFEALWYCVRWSIASPVASTTYFYPLVAQTSTLNTTEALTKTTLRGNGTLKHGYANVTVNSNTQNTTFSTRVNGATTGPAVSVTASSTGIFEDTSGSVAVSNGDQVNMCFINGTNTGSMTAAFGAQFSPGTDQVVPHLAGTALGQAFGTTTNYVCIDGTLATAGTTESLVQTSLRGRYKATGLFAYVSANGAGSGNGTLVLRKNTADANLTISIPFSSTGYFEDTSHNDYFIAGDLINTKMTGLTGNITLTQDGVHLYYGAPMIGGHGRSPINSTWVWPRNRHELLWNRKDMGSIVMNRWMFGSVLGAGASAGVVTAQGQAGSISASAGVATAAAVSISTAMAVGASAGVGAASAQAGSIGASAGVGAAIGQSGSKALSAGVAAPTAVGSSTATAAGASAGVGAATAVGTGQAKAVGASAGVGAASGIGSNVFEGFEYLINTPIPALVADGWTPITGTNESGSPKSTSHVTNGTYSWFMDSTVAGQYLVGIVYPSIPVGATKIKIDYTFGTVSGTNTIILTDESTQAVAASSGTGTLTINVDATQVGTGALVFGINGHVSATFDNLRFTDNGGTLKGQIDSFENWTPGEQVDIPTGWTYATASANKISGVGADTSWHTEGSQSMTLTVGSTDQGGAIYWYKAHDTTGVLTLTLDYNNFASTNATTTGIGSATGAGIILLVGTTLGDNTYGEAFVMPGAGASGTMSIDLSGNGSMTDAVITLALTDTTTASLDNMQLVLPTGSFGVSAGVAVATAVGAATFKGVGAAAGTGAAAAVGNSTAKSPGSSTGTGAAAATGISTAASVGASSGTGDAEGVAQIQGSGSAAGVGTATAVGNSTAKSPGSAAGVGAATAVGNSTAKAAGASSGVADAEGWGDALDPTVGSSSGSATTAAVGNSTAASPASSAGVAAAAGVGNSTAKSPGSSTGIAAAAAVGNSTADSPASSSGVAAASGVGEARFLGDGAAAGVAIAAAVGTGLNPTAGASAGTGVVAAVGFAGGFGAGSSTGTGAASAAGKSLDTSDGFARGVGTATAVGTAKRFAVGAASGRAKAFGREQTGDIGLFSPFPVEQVADSKLLEADGYIELFQIKLSDNATVIYLKNNSGVVWQNNEYEGTSVKVTGVASYADTTASRPSFQVLNPMGVYSFLVDQGLMDNATIVRIRILKEHLDQDIPVYRREQWRVSRISQLTGQYLIVELREMLDGAMFVTPSRMFIPPDFPIVSLQ